MLNYSVVVILRFRLKLDSRKTTTQERRGVPTQYGSLDLHLCHYKERVNGYVVREKTGEMDIVESIRGRDI